MYQGTNPSALRSREWLRQSLMELLKTRRYEQVTIKDICRKADLSRQTFYQIYTSKDEIMEYHFLRLFELFSEQCGSFHDISIRELSLRFFAFFYEQRQFVQELIDNNMSYILEQQFEVFLPRIVLFSKINEAEPYPDYSVSFVAGALTQTLIHWFQKGFDLSLNEIADITDKNIKGVGNIYSFV